MNACLAWHSLVERDLPHTEKLQLPWRSALLGPVTRHYEHRAYQHMDTTTLTVVRIPYTRGL